MQSGLATWHVLPSPSTPLTPYIIPNFTPNSHQGWKIRTHPRPYWGSSLPTSLDSFVISICNIIEVTLHLNRESKRERARDYPFYRLRLLFTLKTMVSQIQKALAPFLLTAQLRAALNQQRWRLKIGACIQVVSSASGLVVQIVALLKYI